MDALSAQACYSKDRPVFYWTSRLKSRVSVNTRYALLKTPTLKSNKQYEGCSNMNASSFITFFMYLLLQNVIPFLERTICRLQNGTKHKETLTFFLELQSLI